MRQIITRVEEPLAEAVKEHAALSGESVNAYITRLLWAAVGGRRAWKSHAVSVGLLQSRGTGPLASSRAAVSTAPGYASGLVTAERDER